MSDVYALILAGGSGTRFWPASRRARPKQLLALAPKSELPLIADTLRRIGPLVSNDRVYIATGEALVPGTRKALPELPSSAFLAEPTPRNTAPCIAWATGLIARRDPNAVVMVLPSDHHIGNETRFLEVLSQALASARAGAITTVGIEPTRADTGYGYIELGEALGNGRKGLRFVEKPDRATAERYFASGQFVWNSGMFFFRASEMLGAIEQHLPELHAGLERIQSAASEGPERERDETRRVFPGLPSISIDHGVMEKLESFQVVPGNFGWSDLGSWETAWDLGVKDENGNSSNTPTIAIDAKNNLVLDLRTDKARRVVAAVGVEGLCIVQTDDAVLVIPRSRSQDVRAIVEELTRLGHDDKI